MKITAYSAAINSLLTTSSGQIGMGSRYPELEINQAYIFEAILSGDINLNMLTGVGTADDAVELIGGNGEAIDGVEIELEELAQIHIRNTGNTVFLVSLEYGGDNNVISCFPVNPGGEIALFSPKYVDEATLDIVAKSAGDLISVKVFVSGKQ